MSDNKLEARARLWISENVILDPGASGWETEAAVDAFEASRLGQGDHIVDLLPFESLVREQLDISTDEPICARLADTLGLEYFDPTEVTSIQVDEVISGLLPATGVHMVLGMPETGKSWLTYEMAAAIARGRLFAGNYKTKRGRVVVNEWEVGSDEVKRRCKLLKVTADDKLMLKSFPGLKLTDAAYWNELSKLEPNFVLLDSLSAGCSGAALPESDARFAEPLHLAMAFCERETTKRRTRGTQNPHCAVLFIHHSPKASTSRDAESLFRGTGALRAAVDTAIHVEKLPGADLRMKATCAKVRKGEKKFDPFTVSLASATGVQLVRKGQGIQVVRLEYARVRSGHHAARNLGGTDRGRAQSPAFSRCDHPR